MISLRERVEEILDGYCEDDYTLEDVCQDVCNHGCQSGLIGELIYYRDTVAFFEEFKDEINELLAETMGEFGGSQKDIFGDKWDSDDPLALEDFNKNLLAWFAFEEITRRIAYENSFDI